MLKALYQLNSKPVVVLKNIGYTDSEKCLEPKLPDFVVKPESDDMQRHKVVKKSPDPRDQSSSSINIKINLKGNYLTYKNLFQISVCIQTLIMFLKFYDFRCPNLS